MPKNYILFFKAYIKSMKCCKIFVSNFFIFILLVYSYLWNRDHNIFTLNCMIQPSVGVRSWVTAYTSLPSWLPQIMTPSGESQNLSTVQSSWNSQCSFT